MRFVNSCCLLHGIHVDGWTSALTKMKRKKSHNFGRGKKSLKTSSLKYSKRVKSRLSLDNFKLKMNEKRKKCCTKCLQKMSERRRNAKTSNGINEEDIFELIFTSQQLNAKMFRKFCFNEPFPRS